MGGTSSAGEFYYWTPTTADSTNYTIATPITGSWVSTVSPSLLSKYYEKVERDLLGRDEQRRVVEPATPLERLRRDVGRFLGQVL